ncbi:two-component system, LytT family, sensor kinase [Haloechinothrix alba]|uniref:Two-component system, LytT family, sensor kinase n=1 Tax=Haloechinothrix alba TaxID=664784 RepID=A0A238V1Q7_9PSEU|nr:two-component system, LytT family, sensor kinase [Haloechinothrix alba]
MPNPPSIDVVTSVPASLVLPWSVATLAVVVLLWVLIRSRRPGKATEDAVLDAVHRLSLAAPGLREGLDQSAADRITMHLLLLLKCVAVGITDRHGILQSWDGEANDHYVDLEPAITAARVRHRREIVAHENLFCSARGECRMRTAVVIPLIVEGSTQAVLIVVGRSRGQRLMQMADAVAQFVRTQFELASLEESKRALNEAEIKALRAQISPHFIYNALNTISSMIEKDPEQANDLLHEFADFTRYSFRQSSMFTTLAEELRNIERYLAIESARFDDRLDVRIKIAREVLTVVVPFLLIQPLVENAVKHGLAQKPSGGTVSVVAEDAGNEAVISVEDDGVGMDPAKLTELQNAHARSSGHHVGLGSLNKRMRQLFGDEYALVVETAVNAGMKVTLRVPKFTPGVRPDLPDYGVGKDGEPEGTPELPGQRDGSAGGRGSTKPSMSPVDGV